MSATSRAPGWTSHRRLLEQTLSEIHKCANTSLVQRVHAQVFRFHLHSDLFVAPKLVAAYSLNRLISAAASVFYLVPRPNAHLCNTIMRAYADNSMPYQTFSVFFYMQQNSIFPDNFTFPCLLKSFTILKSEKLVSQVEMIHGQIFKAGFLGDVFVPNSLLDSYYKCASAAAARKLFNDMPSRDIVSWNTMIAGLVREGDLSSARKLFDEMPVRDTITWNAIITGYAKLGEVDEAFELFKVMPERNIVSWSTIISGYCSIGDMITARMLFDTMPSRNLVSWTIIISGYAEKGQAREAMGLFRRMEEDGSMMDDAAMVSILSACAESGMLELGQKVEAHVKRCKIRVTAQVSNAFLDMYSKCGDLNRAREVFESMEVKDLVSWNTMVQGLALHGSGEEALALFSKMKELEKMGIFPDGLTFLGLLSACAHSGLVEEGRQVFDSMEREFSVKPSVEHFGCMVDLLGRNGLLKEAFSFVKKMPVEPNEVIWGTLLVACRARGDVDLAEKVVAELAKIPDSEGSCGNLVAMSGVYAAAKRWDDVATMRMKMRVTRKEKSTGCSSIEVGGEVSNFSAGDGSHGQWKGISEMVDQLGYHIRCLDQPSQAGTGDSLSLLTMFDQV